MTWLPTAVLCLLFIYLHGKTPRLTQNNNNEEKKPSQLLLVVFANKFEIYIFHTWESVFSYYLALIVLLYLYQKMEKSNCETCKATGTKLSQVTISSFWDLNLRAFFYLSRCVYKVDYVIGILPPLTLPYTAMICSV